MLTGRELSKWFRSSSVSEQYSTSQDQDDLEIGESPTDLPSDMTRFSVMSNDSGIERDFTPNADPSLDTATLNPTWEQGKR